MCGDEDRLGGLRPPRRPQGTHAPLLMPSRRPAHQCTHLVACLAMCDQVEDFEVLGLLGSGGYGSVHLAREPQSGTLVAVKVGHASIPVLGLTTLEAPMPHRARCCRPACTPPRFSPLTLIARLCPVALVQVMLKRPKGVSAPMRVELNVLAQVRQTSNLHHRSNPSLDHLVSSLKPPSSTGQNHGASAESPFLGAACVQVQHPNVVHFYYCLQSASKIYLVMEYIPGGTLKRVLKVTHRPPAIGCLL